MNAYTKKIKIFRKVQLVLLLFVLGFLQLESTAYAIDSKVAIDSTAAIVSKTAINSKTAIDNKAAIDINDNIQRKERSDANTSPMSDFYNFTPRSGQVKALIFMVEFKDVTFEDGKKYEDEKVLSPEELQQALFGEGDASSTFYPYESVKAYYERASYNKLHFSGDVIYYRAKHNRKYYDTLLHSDDKDATVGYETLMMEVIAANEDNIDFTQYDSNNDDIIDAIYLSVPTNGTEDDNTWWGNQTSWWSNSDFTIQGEAIYNYVVLDGQPLDDNIEYYNQVWIHETGHLLGLADYYHASETIGDDWEGFKGEAGYDIMDDMYGDHDSFSKIMCGWIGKKDVQIADYNKSKATYLLKPYEKYPSALIIPVREWKNNFCSEYYLVEYDNGTLNNTGLSENSGIRIWHVDARLREDMWNRNYKLFAYDQNITKSKRNLLTLMGKKDNYTYYNTGDSFSVKNDTKAIYYVKKNDKVKKVPIDFTIKVGKLTKKGYQIQVIR